MAFSGLLPRLNRQSTLTGASGRGSVNWKTPGEKPGGSVCHGFCPGLSWRLVLPQVLPPFWCLASSLTRNGQPVEREEVFMAEHIELLNEFELIQHLILLEDWETIKDMKENT